MKKFIFALLMVVSVGCYASNDVHEYNFKNGLRVLVKEDHRAPVVVMQVWYKVGSSYESNGMTGLSHMLEHMMFKGTQRYPASKMSRMVTEVGGQQNAGTSDDFTFYYHKLAAKDLELGFKLESDRMRNVLFVPSEYKKELKVVMEERRMRTENNPKAKTYERFMAAAHVTSPYHHPVIGWMHDLEQMQMADAKDWYNKWYGPNNAVIVIVGDVDPNQVLQLATRYFKNIKPTPIPTLKTPAEIKPLGKRELVVKVPAKLPWLLMGYNTPSLPVAKQKWQPYALEVLAAVLDGGRSARFDKELTRGQEVALSAGAGYDLYSRLASLFVITGTPAKGHTIKQLKQAIFVQIKNIQQKGITQEELKRVKNQVIAKNVYAKDSLYYQAMLMGQMESVGLSWKEVDNYVKQIRNITAEQVQEVAKRYLVEDHLTVAELDPQPLG